MDPQQQFCLKWNSFGSNLVTTFDTLFKSESLTDVTLFCEGVTFKAHKVILAACSKHFQDLFEAAPHCPGMIVILDGTSSSNMSALLEFMYKGEVHVSHESLSGFLKAAECLQVKGLSIEHEKLAAAQSQGGGSGEGGAPTSLDSPRSVKSGKGGSGAGSKGESESGGASEAGHGVPTTSGSSATPSYTPPVLSPYMHHYMQAAAAYERGGGGSPYHGPPEGPRKRHHRSPSDPMRNSSMRASVLRDGSKPEPLASYPHSSPPYQSPRSPYHGGDQPPPTSTPSLTYDRSAAVEADGRSDGWRSSSCPEDLSIKVEPPGNERSHQGSHQHPGGGGVKSEWGGAYNEGGVVGGGGGGDSYPPELASAALWNCTSKLAASHKTPTATTTPDGKKLQCPFCERLYGYETNLRAHIRQRHQGIRVPCPFCSRTFTRNNTVRRHIAREHKTELSLKAFQPSTAQIPNHNP